MDGCTDPWDTIPSFQIDYCDGEVADPAICKPFKERRVLEKGEPDHLSQEWMVWDWQRWLEYRKVDESKIHWPGYYDFISRILREASKGGEMIYYNSLPVLVRRPSRKIFDVNLSAKEGPDQCSITLRFQLHNLYLIGFRSQSGRWFELSYQDAPKHRTCAQSTMLHMTEVYRSIEVEAKSSRPSLNLGREQFRTAICILAKTKGPILLKEEEEKVAWSILVLLQMIPEAVRFKCIRNQLSLSVTGVERLSSSVVDMQNYWGLISGAMFAHDSLGHNIFPDHRIIGHLKIPGPAQGFNLLGVALHHNPVRRGADKREDEVGVYAGGEGPLGDVKSAKSAFPQGDMAGVGKGKGKWRWVERGGGSSKGNQAEMKHLTMGNSVFYADGSSCIMPCLSTYIGGKLKDNIDMNIPSNFSYDQIMLGEAEGASGTYSVLYAVYSKAVAATVEVFLPSEGTVFGKIQARNNLLHYDSLVYLLSLEEEDSVRVTIGKPIQLTRSIVAVPSDFVFTVRLELCVSDSSEAAKFVNDEIEFTPQRLGVKQKRIPTAVGEVKLRVTWG